MSNSSLIIIEDDAALRMSLTQLLSAHFTTVQSCSRISTAFLLLEKKQYDVALIDRVLPDGSGLELVSFLRESAGQTKVMLMSYLGTPEQRSQGLERGALDYLSKPLHPTEVLLKLKHYQQIYLKQSPNLLSTTSCQLDTDTGVFSYPEGSVRLRKKELQLLACLMYHRPQIVSRLTLLKTVWGTAKPPQLSTIDVYLRRVRTKLGPSAEYVSTVRGFGYVFSDSGVEAPPLEYLH